MFVDLGECWNLVVFFADLGWMLVDLGCFFADCRGFEVDFGGIRRMLVDVV